MITKQEANREGKPVRVYHRAGTVDDRQDEKFAWTHPVEETAECEACQSGNIPGWVKASPE